jgi:signal transduction histidine kinase
MTREIILSPVSVTSDSMLGKLSELTANILSKASLDEVLIEVLDASIDLLEADFGNIHLMDRDQRILRVAARRGFDARLPTSLRAVADASSASGMALEHRERVIIDDVDHDPAFAPYRQLAHRAGFRAVQATPLFAHGGGVLGTISTYFVEPHTPDAFRLRVLDLYARQAADLIEREQQRVAMEEVIDRLEKTSDDLQKANMIKDQFMGLVSHELRTPLAIILGDARLLKNRREGLTSDDVDALLSDVSQEALRLNEMIGHLIGIARSDYTEVQTEPLVLGRTVEAVVREFTEETSVRPVKLMMDAGLPLVSGDEESTRHVILNLLNNADKFCPPGTPILVRCRRLGEGASVSVRDRGGAVNRDSLEKIFEPFYRSPDSTRSKGLGLGLTLCKVLMEKQGGRIWARRRVGGGLSVSLWLPKLQLSDEIAA